MQVVSESRRQVISPRDHGHQIGAHAHREKRQPSVDDSDVAARAIRFVADFAVGGLG